MIHPSLKAMKLAGLLFLALTAAATRAHDTAGAPAAQKPQHLPSVALGASFYTIKAEVATTPQQQEIGLMHRTQMASNEGMLFVFERPATVCFWMKNTLIPLSVAFLDDDGTIVKLDEMKAQTLNPHCAPRPVRLVLEMNAGWFSKRGIKTGLQMTGEPFRR